MIALASKMYFGVGVDGNKDKMSIKGIQEAKNKHLKSLEAYNKLLKKGKSNKCQNVGIRINPDMKTMTTYNITKIGLTPIYTKRIVLEDGRITVPLLNVDL